MFAHNAAPRRVVVTGMGIACPLGVGVGHVWRRLIAGESGISAIQSFDTREFPAKRLTPHTQQQRLAFCKANIKA